MNFILLALGIALILGTGFFVAVEFSLVALETATVYQEREKGDTRANAVLQCLRTLSTQLSSCQIGITITTLLTGYTLDASINSLSVYPVSRVLNVMTIWQNENCVYRVLNKIKKALERE